MGSQIVATVCGKPEIRKHLLKENKVVPLIDVLCSRLEAQWPPYFPNLFHILTLVLSEPLVASEAKNIKENIFKYISVSGLIDLIADFFVQAVHNAAAAAQASASFTDSTKEKEHGAKKNKKKGKKGKAKKKNTVGSGGNDKEDVNNKDSQGKKDKEKDKDQDASDPSSIYLHIVQFLGAITSGSDLRLHAFLLVIQKYLGFLYPL